MPLHLLGKKSWNVYNADNVARVRRDEAEAKAREEAEEQRMQEEDARRRIAILRGEEPPPLKEASLAITSDEAHLRHQQKRPKERKRHGEDDTDFELRLARQSNALATRTREELSQSSNAPLFDSSGHIDLLGSTPKQPKDEKNAEFEAERKKKERELEDQYTMRFSNASGRNGPSNPWYSKDDSARAVKDAPRDAFGREDPGRKDRDERRMNASDPLAMMKRGAAKVRELKQARRNFRAEREAELEEMRREGNIEDVTTGGVDQDQDQDRDHQDLATGDIALAKDADLATGQVQHDTTQAKATILNA